MASASTTTGSTGVASSSARSTTSRLSAGRTCPSVAAGRTRTGHDGGMGATTRCSCARATRATGRSTSSATSCRPSWTTATSASTTPRSSSCIGSTRSRTRRASPSSGASSRSARRDSSSIWRLSRASASTIRGRTDSTLRSSSRRIPSRWVSRRGLRRFRWGFRGTRVDYEELVTRGAREGAA